MRSMRFRRARWTPPRLAPRSWPALGAWRGTNVGHRNALLVRRGLSQRAVGTSLAATPLCLDCGMQVQPTADVPDRSCGATSAQQAAQRFRLLVDEREQLGIQAAVAANHRERWSTRWSRTSRWRSARRVGGLDQDIAVAQRRLAGLGCGHDDDAHGVLGLVEPASVLRSRSPGRGAVSRLKTNKQLAQRSRWRRCCSRSS